MKKKRFLLVMMVLALVIGILLVDSALNRQDRLTNLYIEAFEILMPMDKALNFEMEYIAVETATLTGLDQEHASQVLKHFEDAYGVPVLDAGREYLSSRPDLGTVDELKGLLLRARDVRLWAGPVVSLEVSKYRGNLGAIGSRFRAWYFGGKWRLTGAGGWIS